MSMWSNKTAIFVSNKPGIFNYYAIFFFFTSFSTFAGDNLTGNYIYCVKVSENSISVDSFEFISSYEVNTINIVNAQNHIHSNIEWENRAKTFYKNTNEILEFLNCFPNEYSLPNPNLLA